MTPQAMREMMTIVESSAPFDWSDATQAELRDYAGLFRGDNDDGSPAYFDPADGAWRYDPAFPVSAFSAIMSPADWKRWIAAEIADVTADLGHDRGYTAMMSEEIVDPVVVSLYAGKVHVWDGFHRIGVAVARGDATIKAVVGTPVTRLAGDLHEGAMGDGLAGRRGAAAPPLDNPAFRSWFGNPRQ